MVVHCGAKISRGDGDSVSTDLWCKAGIESRRAFRKKSLIRFISLSLSYTVVEAGEKHLSPRRMRKEYLLIIYFNTKIF